MKGALWNSERNQTTNNISWLRRKKKYSEEKQAQLSSKEKKQKQYKQKAG